MEQMDSSFGAMFYLKAAEEANRKGDYVRASKLFRDAQDRYERGGQTEMAIRCLQQAGVNLRLAGKPEEASKLLHLASRAAANLRLLELELSCEADLAMAFVDMGDTSHARDGLLSALLSYKNMKKIASRSDPKQIVHSLEYAVAIGHLARIDALLGMHQRALSLHEQANAILRGNHDEWELNNLIWWMKELPSGERFDLGFRGIYLATKLRRKQRLIEALLLIISPQLYVSVKNHHARH